MKDLKQQLIRLGEERPDLRRHLSAVLDSISDQKLSSVRAARTTGVFVEAFFTPSNWPLTDQEVSQLEMTLDRFHKDVFLEAGFDGLYIEKIYRDLPENHATRRTIKPVLASTLQRTFRSVFDGDVSFVTEDDIDIRDFQLMGGKTSRAQSLRPQLQKASIVNTGMGDFHSRRQPKQSRDPEAQRVLTAVNAAEREDHIDGMVDAFMSVYGTDSHEVALAILLDESDKFRREFQVSIINRVDAM